MFADVQDSCLFCNISEKSFVWKFYQKLKPSRSYPNVHLKFLHKFCTCLFHVRECSSSCCLVWGEKAISHILWLQMFPMSEVAVEVFHENPAAFGKVYYICASFPFAFQVLQADFKLCKNRLNGKAWTSRTSISWFKYITSCQKLLQDWGKKNPNKIWYRIDRSERMWIFLT